MGSELQTSTVGRIDCLVKRVEEIADCALAPPERTGEDDTITDQQQSPARFKEAAVPTLRDSSVEVRTCSSGTEMADDVAHESRSMRCNTSRRHGMYMGQNSNLKAEVSGLGIQMPPRRPFSSAPTKPEGPDVMSSKAEACTAQHKKAGWPEAIFYNPVAPSWHSVEAASPRWGRRL